MNILIDCDENYVFQLATTIFSASSNIKEPISYFFIQYDDGCLGEDKLDYIKQFLKSEDNFNVICVPHIAVKGDKGRWSDQAAIRLIGLLFLPDSIERILRLDSDVIVNGEINKFYYTPLLKNNIVATKETLPWTKDKITTIGISDKQYINSGVVLYDVKHYKSIVKSYENLALLLNDSNLTTSIDQDFINILYDKNKIVWVDDTYMRFCAKYHKIDKTYKARKPIIYHFAGFHKPWNSSGFVNYRRIYWRYAKKTFGYTRYKKSQVNRIKWYLLYPIRLISRIK